MRRLSKPSSQLMRQYQRRALPAIQQPCRNSSTSSPAVDIKAIRAEMLARPPQIHFDMMYPINSYLLSKTLSDFLPGHGNISLPGILRGRQLSTYGARFKEEETMLLPPGHHLVYFPLHNRGSALCPDGTDPYHSPKDTPFTRRMWAGGSLDHISRMKLDGGWATCKERINDVTMRGFPGEEKIFVEVSRYYKSDSEPGVTERRTLVFMREPSDEQKKANLSQPPKTIKIKTQPTFSITLTPTRHLLFHYSALTYNAHRIHLDQAYCREVEGYRDLLVHGPLSLTLILSALQVQLASNKRYKEQLDKISYRHLAPLYVDQPLRICIMRHPLVGLDGYNDSTLEMRYRRKWDVWVENAEGGVCVKGTVQSFGSRRPPIDFKSVIKPASAW